MSLSVKTSLFPNPVSSESMQIDPCINGKYTECEHTKLDIIIASVGAQKLLQTFTNANVKRRDTHKALRNKHQIKHVSNLTFPPVLNPGITNYEEYSLIQETVEEKKEDGMGTLKKDRTLLRDERKMEKLKAKLHTDDDREFKAFVPNSCWPALMGPRFVRLNKSVMLM